MIFHVNGGSLKITKSKLKLETSILKSLALSFLVLRWHKKMNMQNIAYKNLQFKKNIYSRDFLNNKSKIYFYSKFISKNFQPKKII